MGTTHMSNDFTRGAIYHTGGLWWDGNEKYPAYLFSRRLNPRSESRLCLPRKKGRNLVSIHTHFENKLNTASTWEWSTFWSSTRSIGIVSILVIQPRRCFSDLNPGAGLFQTDYGHHKLVPTSWYTSFDSENFSWSESPNNFNPDTFIRDTESLTMHQLTSAILYIW